MELSFTFGYVQVEEVTIQYCLDATSNHSDRIEEALILEAVDPVEDVQGAVQALGKQIMARYGLSFPCLAYHEQLWKDGN